GCARPRGGLHDLLGRRLDGRRVVGLEADADLVLGYSCQFLSGACGLLLAGTLREGVPWRALRASPMLGARSQRSYLSTSAQRVISPRVLLDDLGDDARADRAPA